MRASQHISSGWSYRAQLQRWRSLLLRQTIPTVALSESVTVEGKHRWMKMAMSICDVFRLPDKPFRERETLLAGIDRRHFISAAKPDGQQLLSVTSPDRMILAFACWLKCFMTWAGGNAELPRP
ncbi:hypothetical protein ACFFW8_17160 [Erwinia tracheiphila]